MDSELSLERNRRQAVPDILKCLGCISVIVIHTASQSMSSLPIPSFNWVCAVLWGCLCRPAVPVFLMVTGALLLDPAKEMSLWRIYEHYFLRILLCLLIWAFAYQLYFIAGYWILYRQFDPAWFVDAVKSVLTFDHHMHLYYLQLLLVLYIFLPLLRTFTAHAGRETQRYILVVWFVLGIIFPFLYKFPPFSGITGIPGQYPISMTYASFGYALMGRYLRNTEIKRRDLGRWLALFIAGFALVFGVTVAVSMAQGRLYQDFLDGFTPGVALMAIGAYGSASALFSGRDSASMPKVRALSRASFCVYLSHHFFVMLLRTYLYRAYTWFCLLVIPAQAAVVLAASLLVYVILSKIPWVKNHLI